MNTPATIAELLAAAEALRRAGDPAGAVDLLERAASLTEVPEAAVCLALARCHRTAGDAEAVRRWCLAVVDAGDDYASWERAASLLPDDPPDAPGVARRARLVVVGSWTTSYLVPLLRLAARRRGIALEVVESGFGQYRQDVLDPSSALYAAEPDLVLLAVHEDEVSLPELADDPDAAVDQELARWTALWDQIRRRTNARILQTGFVVPAHPPLGHLAARQRGSGYRLRQELAARLADAADAAGVVIVDCDRLAGALGKDAWRDPRWWNLSKQAVAMDAQPLLARHVVAVIAAELGLTRKCLVVDLDNTLWGGVVGDDGLAGLKLGDGATGEAFTALQEEILALGRRGVVLAVCSKNDDATAREVFQKHTEMRVRLDDVAVFVANWDPKPENLRRIAAELDLGLDSLVFLDDNPVERQEVRRFLPDVDVIALPSRVELYARTLATYLGFETASFTADDAARTEQYRARAEARAAETGAASIEDFWLELRMRAWAGPVRPDDVARVVQLIGKTNQFNLTTRRHGPSDVEAIVASPDWVDIALRLRDRYADHGLVSVALAHRDGTDLEIDTWLMSCRVIGRTVERTMLDQLAGGARRLGCTTIRGRYFPTAKNALVRDLYAGLGFELEGDEDGATTWRLDLDNADVPTNDFIAVVDGEDYRDDAG